MFGYVRPVKGELKVAEYEAFKAQYCGLCYTLGRRYGISAKFALNYDLAFFAAALAGLESGVGITHRRCMASPFKKKCITCAYNPDKNAGNGDAGVREEAGGGISLLRSSELAADVTVIFTYWKMCDAVNDGGFVKSLLSRAPRFIFKRSYKKAEKLRPGLCGVVKEAVEALSLLEKEKSDSIDRCADTFAGMLSAAAGEFTRDIKAARVLRSLFYHVGRWIYIVDACDDFTQDNSSGGYNPIRYRYNVPEAEIPDGIKEEIKVTLSHSIAAACAAFELLDFGVSRGLVENVLYIGLESVTNQVLGGRWKQRRRLHDRPL
ncbi:MAG: DUF5685 family protein [Oscillospiraceae bacterium]|jgi:hypothetical protein|nr:DUF5685 family protein [Oscillospiraceae bacterium]